MVESRRSLLILGTGLGALHVADIARDAGFTVAGFVENENAEKTRSPLEGLPIHWVEELTALAKEHVAVCGLGTTTRDRFTGQAERAGVSFATVLHPSAQISSKAVIGRGCVAGPGVIVAAYAELDRHVFVNRAAMVGHHSTIADHVSLMPGANVAGVCSIGPCTYIGMGACIVNGVTIGSHSVVGAGAVVTNDLPDNVLAVGVPAKVIKEGIAGK